MEERYWHFKNSRLFEQLNDADIAELERGALTRQYKRGDVIYLPADYGDSALLLISGRVKQYTITAEGKEAVLAFIEPGELFGELPVVTGGTRDEFAEAMEKCQLVVIPGESIRKLMDSHAGFAVGITKLMGLRRRRFERRLKALLFRSNRERLVHLILELTEQYGRRCPNGQIELTLKLSHQELANVIGSTRESVTVMLGRLQLDGYIAVQRRRIIVKNLSALAAELDVPPPPVEPASHLHGAGSVPCAS
ncbi:Crp/Fnr family transcriptional regulator [Calycomorphotria hydatis]|uniref:Global nitrogen regulator n=1 Tax=Calycomorphotria hydatis TaxID=2528027 RepID=A0A517T4E4_9PLAN|nr:Crp/Fnr family transcriptional regulator [Calycomorphotria hydatis]QDT63235.1 Global nitrogen regulator [Calycomorphotria hydatis]